MQGFLRGNARLGQAAGAALALLLAGTAGAQAQCFISGQFFIDSPGPFYISVAASPGKPCDGNVSTGGRIIFKTLWVTEEPRNGRVDLRKGGYYSYTAKKGYAGKDAFTLKLCGEYDRKEYCTILKYAVSVS